MNGTASRDETPRHPADCERFWSKVQKTETCWLWTSALNYGYGVFHLKHSTGSAHRLSYEILVGPIPDGMHLDHLCHNDDPDCLRVADCLHRRCVNPAHLRPVTHAENVRAGHVGQINRARIIARTVCKNGHEYTSDGVYVSKQGWRHCRSCMRESQGYSGPARRIQQSEIDEIRRRLALGEPKEHVARAVGVAPSTIWRLNRDGRL